MSKENSILIIGGGKAGVGIAQALDKAAPANLKVTLVTEFDYLRHHPASLRAIVTAEGELEKHVIAGYDKIFGRHTKDGIGRVGKVKIAKVLGVEEASHGGSVLLESGERLHWDYLVVASGSEWNGPLRWPRKAEDVPSYLETWRKKFSSAKSIAVVGAGAVGVGESGFFSHTTFLTSYF